ncbi:MAG: hypothetical protein ABR567_18185 [Myxococcales bacterium]
MIPYLNDEDHERLWRICDQLVTQGGARAAVLCDAENGSVVISVGEAGATGSVAKVEVLAPGEHLVHGSAGEIYGVDVPGGGLLAVLHDPPALEKVRAAATEAVRNMANLLASLPPPQAPMPEAHVHEPTPAPKAKAKAKAKTKVKTKRKTRTSTTTSTKRRPKTTASTKRGRAGKASRSKAGKKRR